MYSFASSTMRAYSVGVVLDLTAMLSSFGAVAVTLSPNASDMILGPDITGADDKDLINTKATAKRGDFATILATAFSGATNDDTRHALLRLLGRAGGEQAGEIVTKALKEGKALDKLNAVLSLQQWADDSMFSTLTDFLGETEDETLRARAFKGALTFLMDKNRKRSDEDSEDFWKTLASSAKTSAEQESMVRALANNEPTEWAMSVVEYFFDESDSDKVQDLADKALSRMRERAKVLGIGSTDEEEEEKEDEDEKKDSDEEEEEE